MAGRGAAAWPPRGRWWPFEETFAAVGLVLVALRGDLMHHRPEDLRLFMGMRKVC